MSKRFYWPGSKLAGSRTRVRTTRTSRVETWGLKNHKSEKNERSFAKNQTSDESIVGYSRHASIGACKPLQTEPTSVSHRLILRIRRVFGNVPNRWRHKLDFSRGQHIKNDCKSFAIVIFFNRKLSILPCSPRLIHA